MPDFQARISAMCERIADRKSLRPVEFKVAPTQADADQLIAALHTGNMRVAWSPNRQLAFFQAQVDAGATIDQLRHRYPTVDLDSFATQIEMLDLFKKVKYEDPTLDDFLRSRKFKMFIFTRIYESKPFQDLTGFRISDAKRKLGVSQACFKDMAENILTGMRDGDINTRTLGTVRSPRFAKLIHELTVIRDEHHPDQGSLSPYNAGGEGDGDGKPAGGTGGSTNPNGGPRSGPTGDRGGGNERGAPAESERKSPRPKPKPPKPQRLLDMSQIVVPQPFPYSVHAIVGELSVLDIQRFPNAAFDLIRTLLEKAIKAHAESKGVDIRKSGKNQNGFVFLKQCLEWLEEDLRGGKDRGLASGHRKSAVVEGRQLRRGQDHLNAINHNHKIFAEPREVIDGWNSMLPLLSAMMPT